MNKHKTTLTKIQTGILGIVILVTLAAMGLSGTTATEVGLETWYPQLTLPSFTPPGSVIGIVWTCLYICLAIAAFVTMTRKITPGKRIELAFLYTGIAVLTAIWSWIFFVQHLLLAAAFEALALGLLTIFTLIESSRQTKAAWFLAPYAGWVLFASFLTFMVWSLNT